MGNELNSLTVQIGNISAVKYKYKNAKDSSVETNDNNILLEYKHSYK